MRRAAFALVLLSLLIAIGCGGESTVYTEPEKEKLFPWLTGPSREFLVRNGDNAVQTFGREATKAERKQASEVIEAWMAARADRDWAEGCRYLTSKEIAEALASASRPGQQKASSCAEAVAALLERLPPSYFADTTTGEIDSLRIGEGLGFAQYHGNDGRDWVIIVRREKGKWMVAEIDPKDRMK